MKDIAVLIIDSNVTVRLALSRIIRETDNLSIRGTFSSKEIQDPVTLISENSPSVILLGIDKKKSIEMDLFFLIRKRFPNMPLIVITPLDQEGAAVAIKALKNGAVDYLTRPVNRCGTLLAHKHFVKRLVPLLKSVPRLNLKSANELTEPAKNVDLVSEASMRGSLKPVDIVVISGCTGGVQALYPLMSSFPGDLSVPVIIVQHMPKIYTEVLARELDLITPLNVCEAMDNSLLVPGNVYVVPGGYHAEVKNYGTQKSIVLHRGPREQENRPSMDVLIRSIDQIYHNQALCVVLSGSGEDGLHGAKELIEAGGQVILQNPNSSLLWDLPNKIMDKGYYSGIFHPKRIGYEVSLSIKKSIMRKPVYNDGRGSVSAEKWAVG